MSRLFVPGAALITGAGSGLGRAIAQRLVSEGVAVALLDLDLPSLEHTAALVGRSGVSVSTHVADVTCADQVCQAVTAARSKHHRIGSLVNSAGIGPCLPLFDMTPEEWDRVFAVNMRGTFLISREFARYAVEDGGGSIVNIASIAARQANEPLIAYAASKGAVIEFTHGMARALARRNVRVNTVLPGFIWTPMWEQSAAWLQHNRAFSDMLGLRAGSPPREVFDAVIQRMVPTGQPQSAEDVAAAVAFFLSAEARSITGQSLAVDGGTTMM